jgi:hypothetical protein
MAEANRSISQIPTIRITIAAHVLAQLRARGAVKRELQKQGLKVTHYFAKEISSWARLYVEDHPQLLSEARPVIERWIAEGVFGKRAAKAFKEGLLNGQFEGERSVANGQL